MKDPLFVPTSSDINWYEMRKDLDKCVNQLRFKARNVPETNANATSSALKISKDLELSCLKWSLWRESLRTDW